MAVLRITIHTSGDIQSYDDYDVWGLQLDARSGTLSSTYDKYKFTDKERDTETGYHYHGARYYDSKIARWTSVDPMQDKYPGVSPYNYCLNNPMTFTDPDGTSIKPTDDDKKLFQEHKENLVQLKKSWGKGDVLGIVVNLAKRLMTTIKIESKTLTLLPEVGIIDIGMNSAAKSLVVEGAEKPYNSQISEGARSLAKKVGHAEKEGVQSAFSGIRPTTENAQSLVKNILDNPVRQVVGKKTTDIYNAVGQGIRIDSKTKEFLYFIEETKATR